MIESKQQIIVKLSVNKTVCLMQIKRKALEMHTKCNMKKNTLIESYD